MTGQTPLPRRPSRSSGRDQLEDQNGIIAGHEAATDWQKSRSALLREIEADFAATGGRTGEAHIAPEVARAMLAVPRHEFVNPAQREFAYENFPLPIGRGQTISQPFIVAIMSQLARAGPGDRVLEVGTGSGYQAAVLAELGARVFTIETIPELASRAAATLDRLGYRKVTVRVGDGTLGWPEEAPFDAIIVTAGGRAVPKALIDQLAPGGRMVIPVGGYGFQSLKVIARHQNGDLDSTDVLPVAFVPLVDGDAARRQDI